MENQFIHNCPHCGAVLSVSKLPVERTASKCPTCHNYVVLKDYGETMLKPVVYTCPKCGELHIYETRPPAIKCDKCGNIFVTSEKGQSLIDPALLAKGDKGELPIRKKKDKFIALCNKWRLLPTGRKVFVYGLLCVILMSLVALYISSLPVSIESTKAYAAMDSIWTEFRNKNPYNIQIEGIREFDDNSYVVLLTEPSSSVDSASIHKFFKKYNCSFKTKKTKIGYDGWLKDAVICFNDIKPDKIQSLAKELSNLLYGTDYKASFISLDNIPSHTEYSAYNLNESVSEEELRSWFIEENENLVCTSDTSIVSPMSELLSQEHPSDVYYSEQPGFVVWIIDKGTSEEDIFRRCARKFSLDTDLIFGAISNEHRVAIIGRERCVPLYELPPMRVETLCLLAGTEKDQLSQSYERTTLFSGKLPGGKDYAPIYLSEELWHTEYGSILNVTDQMLKSWSENGNVDYVDFNYTKPVNWAFEEGAFEDLHVGELTYNWNTAGAGYIVEDDSYSIYALNRTGSLPVSYIPGETEGISDGDPVYKAEQKAYDFFSYLSCPELVKVVQYVAMYQIFQNLDVHASFTPTSYDAAIIPDEFNSDALDLLKRLANLNENDIKKITTKYNATISNNGTGLCVNDKYYIKSKNSDVPTSLLATWLTVVAGDTTASFYKDTYKLYSCYDYLCKIDSLHQVLNRVKDDDAYMTSQAGALVLRDIDVEYSESDIPLFTGIDQFKSHKELVGDAYSMLSGKSWTLQHFRDDFAKRKISRYRDIIVEQNADKSSIWIKCPTIVLSWSLSDSVNSVGGHNLDSKVTRFKVTKKAKTGKPKEHDGIVEVSESDRAMHITDQSYLRQVGRLNDVDLKNGKTITVRPRNEVVGIAKKRSARGYNVTDHGSFTVKVDGDGFRINNGEKITDVTTLFETIAKQNVENANGDVITIKLEDFDQAGVKVDVFVEGLHATMKKGSCSSIPLDKFDFQHYTTKTEGNKALVTIPIMAGDIQFGSTSKLVQAGLGGSTKVSPKIPIADGKVIFSVPKGKLQAFLNALKEFFSSYKGYMNENFLNQILRKHGINPFLLKQEIILDVPVKKEMKHLKIAIIPHQKRHYYVLDIQQAYTA